MSDHPQQLPLDHLQRCWFLAGPTACGKSATALLLAAELDAEIIALDSMSLYRGMDIGTAKPSRVERERVPHHLIDILDPHQEFSVADYLMAAQRAVAEIIARGRTPLFVGGTGLYLRALLRGVFDGPPADPEYRQQLEQHAGNESSKWLHTQLALVDPVSAAKLHPNDSRRLIRALEVQHVTGTPLSAMQQQQPLPEAERPQHVYWLSPPRDWLYDRINRRVDAMLNAGLVAEVQQLLRAEIPLGKTARQALGYKEIIEHLEAGLPLDQAVTTLKTRTRQFAKRQHTWFRNLVECHALEVTPQDSPATLVARLQAMRQ